MCYQRKCRKNTLKSQPDLNQFHFVVTFLIFCKIKLFQVRLLAKPEGLTLWMKVSEKDERDRERENGEGNFYPKVIVNPKQGFILHS